MSIIVIISAIICLWSGFAILGIDGNGASLIAVKGIGIIFILIGTGSFWRILISVKKKDAVNVAKVNYEKALNYVSESKSIEQDRREQEKKEKYTRGLAILNAYINVGLENTDYIESIEERTKVKYIYNFCVGYQKDQEWARKRKDEEIMKRQKEYERALKVERMDEMQTASSVVGGVVLGAALSKAISNSFDKQTKRILKRGAS